MCIAARSHNYSFVQWNGECYDPSQPDGLSAECKAEADPTRCNHCATDECKEQCMEERFASRSSNCFAMDKFAAGCVWPGPWCYYEVETARFTPKCAYEWVNPHVHPQTPHCSVNQTMLSLATAATKPPAAQSHGCRIVAQNLTVDQTQPWQWADVLLTV
eukprot:SAG22_NODE_9657_length_576_cov_1.324948_1_plen_159_part_10